jgi:hypothetical protein
MQYNLMFIKYDVGAGATGRFAAKGTRTWKASIVLGLIEVPQVLRDLGRDAGGRRQRDEGAGARVT